MEKAFSFRGNNTISNGPECDQQLRTVLTKYGGEKEPEYVLVSIQNHQVV